MTARLGSEFFEFFRDLRDNNEREWFRENKSRYERVVLEPVYELVSAIGEGLAEISPHFLAVPSQTRGSVFRIYRDTRFSRDKSPYKTAQGVRFPHEAGKDVHAPGFYLHLDPAGSFAAAGAWRPDREALAAYRNAIVDDPQAWGRLREDDLFEDFEIGGDSLKRPPRGFPADHPWVEDLQRKDFILSTSLTEAQVCGPRLVEDFLGRCRQAAPWVRFLCAARGVPF